MADRIIDDNAVISFVDDNGVQCFVDDLGNFTCLTSTTTRRYRYIAINVCIALIASAVVMAMQW